MTQATYGLFGDFRVSGPAAGGWWRPARLWAPLTPMASGLHLLQVLPLRRLVTCPVGVAYVWYSEGWLFAGWRQGGEYGLFSKQVRSLKAGC